MAGITIGLSNTFSPVVNYFNIDVPTKVNIIIVTIVFISVFLLIFFLNQMFRKNIDRTIDMRKLSRGWLWIMPVSFKTFFLSIWSYALFGVFAVLGTVAYIEYGNWFILLTATVTLFLTIGMPGLATIAEGNTRVKFLGGRKSNIFPEK